MEIGEITYYRRYVDDIINHILQNKINHKVHEQYKNSVALVCERTIPTERPPPVGEVSANFCG